MKEILLLVPNKFCPNNTLHFSHLRNLLYVSYLNKRYQYINDVLGTVVYLASTYCYSIIPFTVFYFIGFFFWQSIWINILTRFIYWQLFRQFYLLKFSLVDKFQIKFSVIKKKKNNYSFSYFFRLRAFFCNTSDISRIVDIDTITIQKMK